MYSFEDLQPHATARIPRCAAIGLLLTTACRPPAAEPDPEAVLASLTPAIVLDGEAAPGWTLSDRMSFASAPGVAVTLVDSSGPVWTRTAGQLRADGDAPIESETRFLAKSLSKPVTAFATLRLVEQGLLDLDAELGSYLKRWTIPDNEFTRSHPPTLRQVLAHRAGFTMWGVPSYGPEDELPTVVQVLDGEAPATSDPVTIDFEPGSRSRYSGGGYSVLQVLLEDVTGEPFPALMRRLVLDPLGMESSLFNPGVPDSLRAVTAWGHDADGQPYADWDALVQMAAGGLISTAPDLGRFVAEVLRAYAGGSDLLSRETARSMLEDQGDGRSLGFEVAGTGDSLVFSHTGSGDGFRTLFVGVPARGQGLVVLVNADGSRPAELRYEIVRGAALVYGWPGLGPEQRRVADVDRTWYERLTGRYEYSDGSVTVVTLSDDGLHAAWDGSDADPLILPRDSLRFFSRAGETFTFELNGDAVTALVWSGDFGSFRAERKP